MRPKDDEERVSFVSKREGTKRRRGRGEGMKREGSKLTKEELQMHQSLGEMMSMSFIRDQRGLEGSS